MALLPLACPITSDTASFGGILNAGVDVVAARAAPRDLAPLPLEEPPDQGAQLVPAPLAGHLAPVLGHPDYVARAVPPGV